MVNAQNTSISREPPINFAWEGLIRGGKTGLIVSTFYAVVGLVVIEFLSEGMGFLSLPSETADWGHFVVIIFAVITMILFLAILPATIIGAVTGMCLGQLAKLTGQIMPRHLFLSLCVSLCLATVILFHILFKIPIKLSFQSPDSTYSIGVYGTYPFYIGIPSVIYVLMGIWVGWKLYSKVGIQRDK